VLFRSGELIAMHLKDRIQPGQDVLDMGCGSGVLGVLAMAAGAQIIATDLDPRACAAARANGLLDVRQGDLFEPLSGERFDHIVFNPPYFFGEPDSHPLGTALFGGSELQLLRRFLAQMPAFLNDGGTGWMVLSDLEPRARTLLGEAWILDQSSKIQDETLWIYRRGRG